MGTGNCRCVFRRRPSNKERRWFAEVRSDGDANAGWTSGKSHRGNRAVANRKSNNGKSKAPREASSIDTRRLKARCDRMSVLRQLQEEVAGHLSLRFIAFAGVGLGRTKSRPRAGRGIDP